VPDKELVDRLRAFAFGLLTAGPDVPRHELASHLFDVIELGDRVSAWRPIENPPWKGGRVLLWKASTREHYVAARLTGAHGPGWCTLDGYEILRPTHWMPLPAPPKETP
jgi:hypothetical protein